MDTPHLFKPAGWETELAAMRGVANALAVLPDARSRRRVLGWAAQHFGNEADGPGTRRGHEMDDVDAAAEPAMRDRPEAEREQLAVPDADELYEARVLHCEDEDVLDRPGEAAELVPNARSGGRSRFDLDGLLRGFVDEFHRVAHDWQREITAGVTR